MVKLIANIYMVWLLAFTMSGLMEVGMGLDGVALVAIMFISVWVAGWLTGSDT